MQVGEQISNLNHVVSQTQLDSQEFPNSDHTHVKSLSNIHRVETLYPNINEICVHSYGGYSLKGYSKWFQVSSLYHY